MPPSRRLGPLLPSVAASPVPHVLRRLLPKTASPYLSPLLLRPGRLLSQAAALHLSSEMLRLRRLLPQAASHDSILLPAVVHLRSRPLLLPVAEFVRILPYAAFAEVCLLDSASLIAAPTAPARCAAARSKSESCRRT